MNEEVVQISLPKSLFKKLEAKIKETNFPSVSSYIFFLLSEDVSQIEKRTGQSFSPEDEEKVKDRLRALGYIE